MGLVTQNMKPLLTKQCVWCNKDFPKDKRVSMRTWLSSTKYCSRTCQSEYWVGRPGRKLGKTGQKAWNKGLPLPETQKKQISEKLKVIAKEKGFGKWMVGKSPTIETRQKLREANMQRIKEGKHNFYIDGRTPANKLIRHSLNYKLWREAVFKRDNWTCVDCKQRGVYLEAHHLKPFALFPELRFAIDNGITVCSLCHAKVDIHRARTLTKT